MKTYRKILALGALLMSVAINTHAAGGSKQGYFTGQVIATKYATRHILVASHATETPYRVALSATIKLLNGKKSVLEDVLWGDEVSIKLDNETGDIRELSVIAQY